MQNRIIYGLFAAITIVYVVFFKFWVYFKSPMLLRDINDHLTIYTTTFAGFSFLSIRSFLLKNHHRKNSTETTFFQIRGLNWLIATMWLWAFASLLNIYIPYSIDSVWRGFSDTIISGLNSITLLMAVRYFDEKLFFNFKILKAIGKLNYEKFVFTTYAFFIISTCIAKVVGWVELSEYMMLIPDSLLAIGLVGVLLFNVFIKRGLPEVAWMTFFTFTLLLFSQVLLVYYRINNQNSDLTFFTFFSLIAYKVLLIFILLAESFLWLWKEKNAMLKNQRSQMTHIIRGTIRNLVTELEGRRSFSQTTNVSEAYDTVIARLSHAINFHDYINLEDESKYTNFDRFFKNSLERFSKAEGMVSNIEFQVDLGFYNEIETENAEMIVFAVMELCTNAARSVKKANREHPKIKVIATERSGWLEISVEDNGQGGYRSDSLPSEKTGYGTQYLNLIIRNHFKGEWSVVPKTNETGSVAIIKLSNSQIIES